MKILRFGRLGLPRTLIHILFALFENESSVTSVTSSDFKRASQKRTLERVGITQILTESIQIPYIHNNLNLLKIPSANIFTIIQ